jgi:hypothetical protein
MTAWVARPTSVSDHGRHFCQGLTGVVRPPGSTTTRRRSESVGTTVRELAAEFDAMRDRGAAPRTRGRAELGAPPTVVGGP